MRNNGAGEYVRRMDHVVWKVVNERGILLNLENGAYFDVDPVGFSIWLACDGLTKRDDISKKISRKFKVDFKRAAPDTAEFLGELKRAKLVELLSTPMRASAKS